MIATDRTTLQALFLGASLLTGGVAQAQLRVEIAGVGSGQIPIAVAAFADEGVAPAQVSQVIKADLERSGLFKLIDAGPALSETQAIDFSQWKARGADALVVGSVQRLADGRFAVRYKLLDTIKSAALSALSQAARPDDTRLSAHLIADDIYEKLTGIRGAFATRIAYVNEAGPNDFRLEVADADGEGTHVVLHSKESIVSPAWSPDGSKVAYVSTATGKTVVHVYDVANGTHTVLSNAKGSNSAPAWSPDGRKLALVLSLTGTSQVYTVNADGSGLRRASSGSSYDSEPRFSNDGQTLYFTSERHGGWHIYKMSVDGGEATRLTFNGANNISPRLSPDSKTLAWISQRNGEFSLYAMDLASGQEQRLADAATEPSFSPNGKYIMYATHAGERKWLAVVSTDGRIQQRLTSQAGNIREPSWGPYRTPAALPLKDNTKL